MNPSRGLRPVRRRASSALLESAEAIADLATATLTAMLDREGLTGLEVLVTPIGDDADALTPGERASLESQLPARRAASGAARRAARLLCNRLGVRAPEIPRSPRGQPLWPAGLTGSLSHDARYAAVAVGRALPFKGLGIDIEPAEPLPAHVGPFIGTVAERRQFVPHPFADKMLFSIKEAVFKSVAGEHTPVLRFHDVTVDLRSRTAHVIGHGTVRWRVITDPLVVAIAWRTLAQARPLRPMASECEGEAARRS